MGVNYLWEDYLTRIKSLPKQHFSNFKGQTWGIDVSINLLRQHDIIPYFVLDGFPHPMKKVAREKRDKVYDAAKSRCKEFYQKGLKRGDLIDEDEHDKNFKDLKSITIPNEKIISFMLDCLLAKGVKVKATPFEAGCCNIVSRIVSDVQSCFSHLA
jgi:hypothetical protein